MPRVSLLARHDGHPLLAAGDKLPAGREDPLHPAYAPAGLWAGSTTRRRERLLWLSLVLLLAGSILHHSSLAGQLPVTIRRGQGGDGNERVGSAVERARPLRFDEPTVTFRENLVPDVAYLTTFPYGGLTNQLMSVLRLAYLGKLTDRVVILPDLVSSPSEAAQHGPLPWSTFFDLSGWSGLTGLSFLHWRDIKQQAVGGQGGPESVEVSETLSCWGAERATPSLEPYSVHAQFWPLDPAIYKPRTTFASLLFMLTRSQRAWLDAQSPPSAGEASGEPRPAYPDEHLLCFDNAFYWNSLIYSNGKQDKGAGVEELRGSDAVWTELGQHLHFNEQVESEVDRILATLLPHGGRRPAFVALHLRQGDFLETGRVKHDMIDDFAREEARLQAELADRQGGRGRSGQRLPVLVATDSADGDLLARVRARGWILIDHDLLDTVNRLDPWWPGVLDSAVLSRAQALVGTALSTFSYVAARRVESWQGGVTAIVKGK